MGDKTRAVIPYNAYVIPALTTALLTARLVLRAPRPTDVTEIRRVLRANHEHLRPWSARPLSSEDPTSISSVSKSVVHQRHEWKAGRAFALMVAEQTRPSRFVGKVSLSGIVRGPFCSAYLGYWIAEEHQGKGFATEAVRAVLDFTFGDAGLHRVQAAVMPRNERSLCVIERLGFRREGYAERYLHIAGAWEDHILFARTSEEHGVSQLKHADG
jgi:ribosomal-protein-alanine N-acetyltransferase